MKEKEKSFNMLLSEKRFPYLSSHRIKDSIVIPAVMFLDLAARAGKGVKPFLKVKKCDKLELKKGILLKDNEEVMIDICCNMNEEIMDFKFLDNKSNLKALGHAHISLELSKPHMTMRDFENRKLPKWPYRVEEVYDKHLFHGKYYRSIKELKGVSENGASAVLYGSIDLGWPPNEGYMLDQAVLDGGGHLQILWSQLIDNKLSLPLSVDSFIPYESGLLQGPIHVELEKVTVNELKKVANIYYFNADGQLVYEIKGFNMYTLPIESYM
jgi:hypothetical protein